MSCECCQGFGPVVRRPAIFFRTQQMNDDCKREELTQTDYVNMFILEKEQGQLDNQWQVPIIARGHG